MSRGIKQRVADFYLAKEEKKNTLRDPKLIGLRKAKTVGLLFEATNIANHKPIQAFERELKDAGVEVKILGFVNQKFTKKKPEPNYPFPFFTRNDLNWYLKPSIQISNTFAKQNFDILIDLSPLNLRPLKFISLGSNAGFKVGRYVKDNSPYDLMIKTTGQEGIEEYLKQVKHYLNTIGNE